MRLNKTHVRTECVTPATSEPQTSVAPRGAGRHLAVTPMGMARTLRTQLPCGLLLLCAASSAAASQGPIDDAFAPTAQTRAICQMVAEAGHWPIEVSHQGEATLPELDAWAQMHLKRPAGQERMGPASIAHYDALWALLRPKQRKQMFKHFQAMGDVGARAPARRAYDYILIHGTTVQGMRARIMAVAKAVERKQLQITPHTTIVFLDGERTLFATEPPQVLGDPAPYPRRPQWQHPDVWPTDERGAAELVWEQLALPEAMRHATPMFIHAAKKPLARRAETEDTVAAWAQRDPGVHGVALMVSENPVVEYQRLVTQSLLYRNGIGGLHLDAMGPDVRLQHEPEAVRLGYMLDNLAACLHWAHNMQRDGVPLHT